MHRVAQRALLASFTILLVLIVSRAAFAQAPFCDFRGATNIAPPPILPVRDVRFEQDLAYQVMLFCEAIRGASRLSERNDRSGHERLSTQDGSSSTDLGCPRALSALPRRNAARRVALTMTRTKGSSGFPPGVYRPPR